MARNRISGLGITVLGSAMLLAIAGACDSGGTTNAPVNGTGTGTGTGTSSDTNTATGAGGGTGTGTGTKAVTTTGGAPHATGGSPSTGTGTGTGTGNTTSTCGTATVPTGTGTLSVTGGYVTTGSLKGYGFTWAGKLNNTATCITPTCDTTGCKPTFGSTALCAAGTVAADTSYNSVVGIGFNLNQDSQGATNGTVAAPANVTVTTVLSGSGAGNSVARVQITDSGSATSWCVDAGKWTSGTPIPITSFNTACWDNSGTYLAAGAQIQAVHITIPSDATADRPFAICLAGVSFQ